MSSLEGPEARAASAPAQVSAGAAQNGAEASIPNQNPAGEKKDEREIELQAAVSKLPEDLQQLMLLLAQHPEMLAPSANSVVVKQDAAAASSDSSQQWWNKQEWLREASKKAIQHFFEQGVSSEQVAMEPIHSFIEAVRPQLTAGPDGTLQQRRITRSNAASAEASKGTKRKRGAAEDGASPEISFAPSQLFSATPLTSLMLPTVPMVNRGGAPSATADPLAQERKRLFERQAAEQLWQQIEMRHETIAKLCDLIVSESHEGEEDEEEEEDADDDEEEELDLNDAEVQAELSTLSDAELRSIGLNPKAFRAMYNKKLSVGQGDDEDDEEDEEQEEDDSEDDDFDDSDDGNEEEEGFAGASDLSDEEEASRIIIEPLKTEEEQMEAKERLAFALTGIELDESEEEEEDEEEEAEEANTESQEAGPSSRPMQNGKRRHPTLDDDFFSIDAFNRETVAGEVNEAIKASGSKGKAADDAEDIDLFQDIGAMDDDDENDEEESGAADLTYADFFAPPSGVSASSGKGKGTGKDKAEEATPSKNVIVPATSTPDTGSPRKLRFNDEVQIRHIKKAPGNRSTDDAAIMEALRKQFEKEKSGLDDDDKDESSDSGSDDEQMLQAGDEYQDEEEEEEEEDDEEEEEEGGEEDEDVSDEDMINTSDFDRSQEDLMDEAEVESQASTEDPDAQTARRVARDLFADDGDDDEEEAGQKLSTHERRQQALAAEIAQLESENVGKKDWTLMGEVGSKVRPQDSLLAEDLDFEYTAKTKPIVTEEVNNTLEDLIKKRILDNNFDDVVKRVQLSATPFLPSKLLELSDSKSSKSLAELYEDDYQQAKESADGAPARLSEADAKLDKEHQEISALFTDIFNKLDALSNAHFTPKAPKTSIQTVSNVAALSMESALPSTSNTASMLAPEEVYDAAAGGRESTSFTGAKGELTPEEKQRAYNRLRKQKRKRNQRIERTKREIEQARENAGIRPKLPKGKAGEKQEKADAMKQLIGTRGVSVVGKDGKRATKESNRGKLRDKQTIEGPSSSTKLKL